MGVWLLDKRNTRYMGGIWRVRFGYKAQFKTQHVPISFSNSTPPKPSQILTILGWSLISYHLISFSNLKCIKTLLSGSFNASFMANINHLKYSSNCGTGLTQAMTWSILHPRVCIEHYNTGQTCRTFSLSNLTLTSEYRLVRLQTGSVGEETVQA